jgi:hypothetical protein
MHLTPNSFGTSLREFNPYHDERGRFTSADKATTTTAGLTSYGRPDQRGSTATARATFEEMRTVAAQLKAIPGVRHAAVYPTQGAYQGGWEPSWTIRYKGNGAARRLLAATGKKYGQSAVLLTRTCRSRCNSVGTEFSFPAVGRATRDALSTFFGKVGLGGWAWYKSGGRTRLRIVAVPHWGGTRVAHQTAMRQVQQRLRAAGLTPRRTDRRLFVETLGPDGEHGYDAVLGGRG